MPVQRLKVAIPTTALTLLWARNPFRGNFNHWQVSRKEAGQIFFDFLFFNLVPVNTMRHHCCSSGAVVGEFYNFGIEKCL